MPHKYVLEGRYMAPLQRQYLIIFFLFIGIIGKTNCLNATEEKLNNNEY